MPDVTEKLTAWSEGKPDALDELMPLVLADLRKAAHYYFEHERPDHTAQPTAVVNELYLRLRRLKTVTWETRAQFFTYAGQQIRYLLVDHARKHRAQIRGRGAAKAPLDEALAVSREQPLDPETLIALDGALERLEELDPLQGRIVELRYFAGMTVPETAEALEISESTVKRNWRMARLWLGRELRESKP